MIDKHDAVTRKDAVRLDEARLDGISGGPTAVEAILATGPNAIILRDNRLKVDIGALKTGV